MPKGIPVSLKLTHRLQHGSTK